MANPFKVFRKNRKSWLVGLGVVTILSFVFVPVFMQMGTSMVGNPANKNVVSTGLFGSLTEIDLQNLRQRRSYMAGFVNELGKALQNNAAKNLENSQRDTQVSKMTEEEKNQKFMAAYMQYQKMVYIGSTLSRMAASMNFMDEKTLVNDWLMARMAERTGMVISDNAISDFILRLCRDPENPSRSLFTESVRAETMSALNLKNEDSLLLSIREYLLAQQYRMSFLNSLGTITPAQKWDYFNRVYRKVITDIVPVPVADFTAQIPDPSDAELLAFFNQYKEIEPNASKSTPGFKYPVRANFQYVVARMADHFNPEAITQDEILTYYNTHKNEFIKTEEDRMMENIQFQNPNIPSSESESQIMPGNDSFIPTNPDAQPTLGKSPFFPLEPAPAILPPQAPATITPAKVITPSGLPENAPATGEKPADTAPATEEKPADTAPATGEKPADTAPATGEKPADTAPVTGEKPADTAPATGEKPADTAPTTGEKPADTAPATGEKPAENAVHAGSKAPFQFVAFQTRPQLRPEQIKEENHNATPTVEYRSVEQVEGFIRNRLARDNALVVMRKKIAAARSELDAYNKELLKHEEKMLHLEDTNKKPEKYVKFDVQSAAKKCDLSAYESAGPMSASDILRDPIGKAADSQSEKPASEVILERDRGYLASELMDDENNIYLCWKTEEPKEPSVPKFTDPGIKDVVKAAYKFQKARPLAQVAATELAKKCMAEKNLDSQGTRKFSPFAFSWLDYGATVETDRASVQPVITPVNNVEAPGNEFMKTVFSMKSGEIAVAPNQPETVYYVVYAKNFFPEEDSLRMRYDNTPYEYYQTAATADQSATYQTWVTQLEKEAGLIWNRKPVLGRGEVE